MRTTRRLALALIMGAAAGALVRAADTYKQGHIPGSLNVPVSNVADHVARLKAAKKPIVAYCA